MEYQILRYASVESYDYNLNALMEVVQEAIGEGWEPLGGICVTQHVRDGDGALIIYTCQAMLRSLRRVN